MNNRKTHKRMGSRLLAILCATLLVATMLPISVAAADFGGVYEGWKHISQDYNDPSATSDYITYNESDHSISINALNSDGEMLFLNRADGDGQNSSAFNQSNFGADIMTDFVIEFDFSVTNYTNKAAVDAGDLAAGYGVLGLAFMGKNPYSFGASSIMARMEYANTGLYWSNYDNVQMPGNYANNYVDGNLDSWKWLFNGSDAKHVKVTKSGNTITMDVANGYITKTATLPSDIGLPESGYVGFMVSYADVTISNVKVQNTTAGQQAYAEYFTAPKANEGGNYENWQHISDSPAGHVSYDETTHGITLNAMDGYVQSLYLNHWLCDDNATKFSTTAMKDFVIEFDFSVTDYYNKATVDAGDLGAGAGMIGLAFLGQNPNGLSAANIMARMEYGNTGLYWNNYDNVVMPGNYANNYIDGKLDQWKWLFNGSDVKHVKVTKSGNAITMDVAYGYLTYTATLPSDIGLPEAGYIGFAAQYATVTFSNVKVTNTATGESALFFHNHAWNTPTCTQPWTCSICGVQTGEAAGHSFADGICGVCGEADPDYNACAHEYFDDCDPVCLLCGELREVSHNVIHVEAKAPTCTENGNVEYWYCDKCGAAWLNEAGTQITNLRNVIAPAYHSGNMEYTAAAEAIDCQNPGNIEYWYCPGCCEYFSDAYAENILNPWFIEITVDCVRPEDAADCAVVPCEVCGENTYGPGEHDVFACQGGVCGKCGDYIEGYGCANYDTPACMDGVCYYCGGFVAGFGHENGAWAACCEGECSYGCGLTYPATEEHVDEDADDYCDNCWNHLNHDVDPCVGGECSICWAMVKGAHTYDNGCDVDCNLCGKTREVEHSVEYVEAKDATCYENGNIEYWYCEDCGQAWLDAECTLNTNLKAVIQPMAHAEATHVEAKAPTCYENGNIEYWYCDKCGAAWLDEAGTIVTNLQAVKLGATCAANAVHNEGIPAGCHYTGMLENWYCATCDVYYLDAACTVITNYKSLTIPALGGEVIHVEAVDATYEQNGNIEYWYCESCEQVWQDEALTQLTNFKNVIRPALEGFVTKGNRTFYYENGAALKGLALIDGSYYFFSTGDGNMKKDCDIFVSANDLGLARGSYKVAADGKIETVKNGFVVSGDRTFYYVNNEKVTGLQKIDGSYYFFSTGDGNMKKDCDIFVSANDLGLARGSYKVAADGKIVTEKEGWVYAADGRIFYYENGEAVKGFKLIDGNAYYFSTGDGNMKKDGAVIWAPAGNAAELERGQYIAGENGVLALA